MAKKEKEVKQKNSYFKDMKTELKKVVWPTPRELVNNTTSVIAFVVIIAVVVFILDFCFDNLNKYGITKLQEKVRTSFQTTEDSNNVTNTESETTENNTENEDVAETTNATSEEQENNTVEKSEEEQNTENSNNESNE